MSSGLVFGQGFVGYGRAGIQWIPCSRDNIGTANTGRVVSEADCRAGSGELWSGIKALIAIVLCALEPSTFSPTRRSGVPRVHTKTREQRQGCGIRAHHVASHEKWCIWVWSTLGSEEFFEPGGWNVHRPMAESKTVCRSDGGVYLVREESRGRVRQGGNRSRYWQKQPAAHKGPRYLGRRVLSRHVRGRSTFRSLATAAHERVELLGR